jgi:NitT/TauT family transport system permease protein
MKNIFDKISVKNYYLSLYATYVVLFLLFLIIQPSKIIPSLQDIGGSLTNLIINRNILGELFISITLCLKAMFYSFVISLFICYLGEVKFGKKGIKIFRPLPFYISKLRFVTLVGLTFVFTLYSPNGYVLKVMLLTFGMTVFFTTSVYDIVTKVEQFEYIHARSLGLSELEVLWEVVILGKFHLVLDAFRQNFAIVWTMITLVEGIVRSDGGIGTILLNENRSLHLAAIFAIQFLILTAGIIQDFLIKKLQSVITPYAQLSLQK